MPEASPYVFRAADASYFLSCGSNMESGGRLPEEQK